MWNGTNVTTRVQSVPNTATAVSAWATVLRSVLGVRRLDSAHLSPRTLLDALLTIAVSFSLIINAFLKNIYEILKNLPVSIIS